jgi:isochorismate synthase EntC
MTTIMTKEELVMHLNTQIKAQAADPIKATTIAEDVVPTAKPAFTVDQTTGPVQPNQ